MTTREVYLVRLRSELKPHYTRPKIKPGHEFVHPARMATLARELTTPPFPKFDPVALETAIWLHNIDKTDAMRSSSQTQTVEEVCRKLLEESPFEDEVRDEIVIAVLQHSKRNDDPNDPTLLYLLRILDKADRLRFPAIELISGAACYSDLPIYDQEAPFGYGSTALSEYKTIYHNFFRILEWWGMLPNDDVRAFVGEKNVRFYVEIIRRFGADVAAAHDVSNKVEEDIQKALGPYYDRFA